MGSSHPDADLHPEATGPAAHIVKSHQAEQPLKLYSGWFCPFVQRVWAVLEEKQIPYQYIEVNPYHKPQSLLKLNPRGLVPTLQYDSKPLFESTVVCEFLEEAYPDHGAKLLPSDPYDRARVRIWTDFVGSRIIPAFHRYLQFQPMDDTEGLDEVRQEFLEKLREFTKEMHPDGPYFLGKEPVLVDFIIAPWIHFKGKGVPESGEDEVWTRFHKFEKAISERQSIKNTLSDREHYLPIYNRYHENKAQSELAKAIRKGRGVP
ncbi:hypothetical protein AMS68_005892 [Peltaster fructicola]|uniref:GST N-terminal domain-containing protein n=1 Tax=Peltaster fructicola TaxID=286661 RepID=A0A6H0Y0D1_9PEZI|nr:hypothetical protein AMS68_005892 [Peltaster fructicola]